MPLRNAFEDLAAEATLAAVLAAVDGHDAPGTRVTIALQVSAAGDNPIVAPAAGMRIRLYWIGLSASQDNAGETLAVVKFGAVEKYRWTMGNPGAFMHREAIDGGVDEALVVNLSAAYAVEVNVTYEEV